MCICHRERGKLEHRGRKGLTDQDGGMAREKNGNGGGDENILRLKAEDKCQMTWLDKKA